MIIRMINCFRYLVLIALHPTKKKIYPLTAVKSTTGFFAVKSALLCFTVTLSTLYMAYVHVAWSL